MIEDDPDVRELLAALLAEDGHDVAAAPDGPVALDLVKRGNSAP